VSSRPPWFYIQSAVVPYRRVGSALEVLLITSRSGKRWTIPKGIVEPAMTAAASAAKEAYEEAGIRGDVGETALGSYEYTKWGGTCHVEVFPLRVREVLDEWPESHARQRRWLTIEDAVAAVETAGLRDVLSGVAGSLETDG
jgi:phosphohistidine phosphatase